MGPFQTGLSGGGCAQNVGHGEKTKDMYRAHGRTVVCIYLILKGKTWCWRGELNPHAG